MRFRFIMLLLFANTAVALAAPPRADEKAVDPQFSHWFTTLQSPSGLFCCNVSDCRFVEYRVTAEGYEFHPLTDYDDRVVKAAETIWTKVPADKLVRKENPTGHAVACYGTSDGLIGDIFCFVPGPGY